MGVFMLSVLGKASESLNLSHYLSEALAVEVRKPLYP